MSYSSKSNAKLVLRLASLEAGSRFSPFLDSTILLKTSRRSKASRCRHEISSESGQTPPTIFHYLRHGFALKHIVFN
ncbi:hypothetical protein V6N13_058861 [Hibiscus sabdariffa]